MHMEAVDETERMGRYKKVGIQNTFFPPQEEQNTGRRCERRSSSDSSVRLDYVETYHIAGTRTSAPIVREKSTPKAKTPTPHAMLRLPGRLSGAAICVDQKRENQF